MRQKKLNKNFILSRGGDQNESKKVGVPHICYYYNYKNKIQIQISSDLG